MARTSRDLVPSLEQLLLDQADLASAAVAVAPPLKQVLKGWRVTPRARQTDLQAIGAVTIGEPPRYAVDREGNLVLARLEAARLAVSKISPQGQMTDIGTAPLMPPYSCFVGAGGEVLVTGIDPTTRRYRVAQVGATVKLLPGYLFELPATPGATISTPNLDLDMDGAGHIYAAFSLDHVIVKLASNSPVPTVIAGAPGEKGYRDGPGSEARFSRPLGLARGADGAIYVADHDNSCIRRIDASGNVTTVAGKPGETDPRFGRASFARFGTPDSIAVGPDGTIYVLDTGGRRVSRISPDGSAFLVAGSGRQALEDGVGPEASFIRPMRLRIDATGRLYVVDVTSATAGGGSTPQQFLLRTMAPD
jgi:DNA-binding beta-propeller fold protein YncE